MKQKKNKKPILICLLSNDFKRVDLYEKRLFGLVKKQSFSIEDFMIETSRNSNCLCQNCVEIRKMRYFINKEMRVLNSEKNVKNTPFVGVVRKIMNEFDAFTSSDSYDERVHSAIMVFSELDDRNGENRIAYNCVGIVDNVANSIKISSKEDSLINLSLKMI